jgi:protein gp37
MMAENTKIDWTDHTWNPWQGCSKISAGCENCYMYRDKKRYGQDPFTVVRSKPNTFNMPRKWEEPAKVFVCSWSDFFIEEADEWRGDAWQIIKDNPHLTFQLLTKRPENICSRLPDNWFNEPYMNVWFGTTVEDQSQLHRAGYLNLFPAAVKFLSIEPMIGSVDLTASINSGLPWSEDMSAIKAVDWVIVGGESGGKDARIIQADWAREVRDVCASENVPFFMKQMTNKKEIPGDLQMREFPTS